MTMKKLAHVLDSSTNYISVLLFEKKRCSLGKELIKILSKTALKRMPTISDKNTY